MEKQMEFTVQLEKKHISDYVLFHTYGKARGKLFIAIGLVALVMAIAMWQEYGAIERFCLVFVAGYYLLVQPALTMIKIQKFAKMPNFYEPIHYVFSDKQIDITQGQEHVTYFWEDGLLFVSRKREVYMYVSAREAYMIPKNSQIDTVALLSMATQHQCPVRAH